MKEHLNMKRKLRIKEEIQLFRKRIENRLCRWQKHRQSLLLKEEPSGWLKSSIYFNKNRKKHQGFLRSILVIQMVKRNSSLTLKMHLRRLRN